MLSFREAVEAQNGEAMAACLADDVTFTSPVAFKPYEGKPITAAILRGVLRVFTDFTYVREIENGRDHALIFKAKVGDVSVNGCDFLRYNEDGLIEDFMVMVRPLSAANALSEAMGAQFPQIAAEAAAGT
ncbi:MAG TPA: nuclear transport factor 2 family protein [Marmoricola sp.]|nr:nuclear transport factor 2 family protein [Marmoricola sp.]